jgi:hypothetical protein
MIKASAHDAKTGRKVLIFGFSHANLVKLIASEPITFPGDAYGYDGDFFIFAGESEEAMAKMFLKISPDLKVYEDPNPS